MGSIKPTLRETAMQLIISICALVAVAFASDPYAPPAPYHPAPAPYHPAPAPYHAPAPAPYHPAPYVEEAPKNYQFGYDVHGYDEYGNPNVHSRTEARDGPTVKGQYRVELPDCRTQIVDYFVDEYKQYHADVKYEGEICQTNHSSNIRPHMPLPLLLITLLLPLLITLLLPLLIMLLPPLLTMPQLSITQLPIMQLPMPLLSMLHWFTPQLVLPMFP